MYNVGEGVTCDEPSLEDMVGCVVGEVSEECVGSSDGELFGESVSSIDVPLGYSLCFWPAGDGVVNEGCALGDDVDHSDGLFTGCKVG